MKIHLSKNQDRFAVACLLASTAYFASSPRVMRWLSGTKTPGVYTITAIAALIIIPRDRMKAFFPLQCVLLVLIPIPLVFINRVELSFMGSLKLTALQITSLLLYRRFTSRSSKAIDGLLAFMAQAGISTEDLDLGIGLCRGITIHTTREKAEKNPEKWLATIAFIFSSYRLETTTLKVKYLGEEGSDGGGLLREFIDNVIHGALQNRNLFERNGDHYLPRVKEKMSEENVYPFLGLGLLLMYLYSSPTKHDSSNPFSHEIPNLYIGNYLNPILFKAALSISEYEFASQEGYNEVALLKSFLEESTGQNFFLELVEWYEMDTPPENKVYQSLNDAVTKTNSIKDDILTALKQSLLFHSILPTYFIARGMHLYAQKQGLSWESFREIYYLQFAAKVQAPLDRDELIQQLNYKNETNKVFLEGWIQNATEPQLLTFLKWQTGVAGNPPEEKTITVQDLNPDLNSPIGSTCGFTLTLPTYFETFEEFKSFFDGVIQSKTFDTV